MRFPGQSMSPQRSFLERSAGEGLVRQIFSVTCAEAELAKVTVGLEAALLLAQRAHGIYLAGATSRYKAGEQRGGEKDRNHDGESRQIGRPHSVDPMLQKTARSESAENAYTNADDNQSKALSEH
jgi:hypothetical protein